MSRMCKREQRQRNSCTHSHHQHWPGMRWKFHAVVN